MESFATAITFIPHPKKNQKTNSDAHAQASDVDECVAFVLEHVAQGDFEVVGEHGSSIGEIEMCCVKRKA